MGTRPDMKGHNGAPIDDEARVRLTRAVLEDRALSIREKTYRIAVAMFCDEDGYFSCSNPRVGDLIGVKDPRVVRLLKQEASDTGEVVDHTVNGVSSRVQLIPVTLLSQRVIDAVAAEYEARKAGGGGGKNALGVGVKTHGVPRGENALGAETPRGENALGKPQPLGENALACKGLPNRPRAHAPAPEPCEEIIKKNPPTRTHEGPISGQPHVGEHGADLYRLNGTTVYVADQARDFWLKEGFDEDGFKLALMIARGEVSEYDVKKGPVGITLRIERTLARELKRSKEQDRRYNAAVEKNASGKAKERFTDNTAMRTGRTMPETARQLGLDINDGGGDT